MSAPAAVASTKRSRTLLLLPPSPSPASYAAIKTAYQTPILAILKELTNSPRQSQGQSLLEIALPVSELPASLRVPRAPYYAHVQQVVAHLYKLICITASRENIDIETIDGIDARIVLVAQSRNSGNKPPTDQVRQGPIITLQTLASSERTWHAVYSATEGGVSGLNKLSMDQFASKAEQDYMQSSVADVVDDSIDSTKDAISHLSVAVGGTFDHLHIGHKLLLTMFAFVLSQDASKTRPEVLTVGITGDALLVNKKYAEHLESWKRRQESTHDFLSSLLWFGASSDSRIQIKEFNESGPNGHAVHVTYPSGLTIRYVEIADPFGPTITDQDITALVLSLETRGGGEAVNNKRREQGWAPLEVFEVDVLDASEEGNVEDNFQSKLSSTEIRKKRSERLQSRSKA